MKEVLNKFNQLLMNDHIEKESDIKVLKEEVVYATGKEYKMKLLFANTAKHGYYGFLNGVGELFLVGEEDEGIESEDIMEIFEVNEYGRNVKRV